MSLVIAVLAGLACTFAVLAAGGRLVLPRPATGPARRRGGPAVRRVQTALDAAGVAHPADAVIGVIVTGCAAAAGAALLLTGSALFAVAAGAAPAGLAVVAQRHRAARRPERAAAQLPGVLRHVAEAVRAGMSLRQALMRAREAAPEPLAAELAAVTADLEQGARAEDALDALAGRVPHDDVRIAVCAMTVTLRSGGDMPRILGDLAANVEDRGRLAAELRGATGQARMTAALVAVLPAVGGLSVEVAAPGTLARTLGEGIGRLAAAVAVLLMAIAWLLVRRLSRVEP